MNYLRNILILVLLVCSNQLKAQNGWFWQHPWPQGNNLNNLHVFNKDMMIAVGDCGTIIKTTDGGDSWLLYPNNYPEIDFQSVTFINPSIGWICGIIQLDNTINGVILKTEDGGDLWNICKDIEDLGFRKIRFWDEIKGWLLAYNTNGDTYFLFTDDGSGSFTYSFIGRCDSNRPYLNCQFFNTDTGWINIGGRLNEYGFYKTTDGGANWDSLNTGFADFYFINADTGWATTSICGWIYWTEFYNTFDGGVTWDRLYSLEGYSEALLFENSKHGWALCTN
jgi:photosystem II stability/assembly factor-like uncharacterized protein